jgi:putative tricarboxylic transport membrane protein
MGPGVSDHDYRKWVTHFERIMAAPGFAELRTAHGLYPFAMTGSRLTGYVDKTMLHYGQQIKELGLIK